MRLLKAHHLAVWLVVLIVQPAFAADRLVLISPHADEIQIEFEAGFKKAYKADTKREVDVEWLDIGGGSSILRYIKSEFGRSPEGIGIDLFFGGGVDPFLELADRGVLVPYQLPDELLARLPERIGGIPLYDSQHRWYGATLSGFGIVYNRKVLDLLHLPVPQTWADLGDPQLYSWVGSGDPRSSGSVHMAYELILQAYGWERGWEVITTLGANVRNFGGGGAQAPKDVAMGEVAYGLSIDFYAWAQVAEVGEAFVGFTMPDNLTIVNPDALAIVKGAPNPDVARAFVRFAMSEPGQKLWFLKQGAPGGPVKSQLNRFTVIPDLYTRHRETAAVALNPFDWTSDLVYDSDLGSTRRSVLNDLIGVLIIDSHNQLQLAWERARAGGVTQEEVRRLSAVPITLEECLKLASSWRDAALRNRRLAEWTAFTRDKYGDPEEHPATRVLDFLTLFFPFGIAGAMVLYVWRTRGL